MVGCIFCKAYFKKKVMAEPGKPCPKCGHYLTCESEPACDRLCEFWGDLYNMDGDCLMEK